MSLEGFEKLVKKLDRLGKDSAKVVAEAVTDAAEKVWTTARENAPVDTGYLEGNIYMDVHEKEGLVTGEIYTSVEYAPCVEFGTGQRGADSPSPPKYDGELLYKTYRPGMAAQPFLYPAMKQHEENIKETIAASIRMEIKKGD